MRVKAGLIGCGGTLATAALGYVLAGLLAGAVPRSDAAVTGLRPWKVVWFRENGGLSVWTSQRRQPFVLTGTKKAGPSDWPAAWSRDGQYIAFSRSSAKPGIYILRVGHGAPRRVATTFAYARAEVAWSPDGREVAYAVDCEEDYSTSTCVSGPTGTSALYTVERDGSDPRQLTALAPATSAEVLPRIRGVTWSRDGRQIAYVADTDDGSFLYTIGSSGGAPRLVAAERSLDYELGNPAWSPNGRWIAYGAHCGIALLGGDIDCSLVASSTSDTTRRVLLNSPGNTQELPPAWTPDSRTVLYAAEGRRGPSLFRIDFATGRARAIMRVFTSVLAVARDGRSFAFAGLVTRPAVATLAGHVVAYGPKIPSFDEAGTGRNASIWIG